MRTKTVAVLPYDPAWKEAFERIKAPLWERLQTWLSAVEHVGSTSVEGLWAKPIIDLDLVLKEPGFFPQVKQGLALLDTSTKGISAPAAGGVRLSRQAGSHGASPVCLSAGFFGTAPASDLSGLSADASGRSPQIQRGQTAGGSFVSP